MKNEYIFTIQIVTYNPNWDKLRFTLDSILVQSFTDYELMIVDDGSKDCLEENIKEYVKEHEIKNFHHIKNKYNQGTVRNIISGLKKANGKYVPCFGAGDAFASTESLQMIYDYMEQNKLDACWGLVQPFVYDEKGGRHCVYRAKPFDIDAYRTYNVKRILENMIVYSDQAHGASITMKKETWLQYLYVIVDKVVYAEDLTQILMALEGNPLPLLDEVIIYYEEEDGISTTQNKAWLDKLQNDVNQLYEYAQACYPKNKYIQKRLHVNRFQNISNLYLRTFLRFFINPDMVFYLGRALKQRIMKKHIKQIKGMIPL